MLNLLPAHVPALLGQLNQPQRLEHWRGLAEQEELCRHLSSHPQPLDTDAADWRLQLISEANQEIARVAAGLGHQQPTGLLGHWLACEDAMALGPADTLKDCRLAEWVSAQIGPLPLLGLRVANTAFWLAGHEEAVWQARPWQGPADPLMSLPYQRKYDSERHGRIDERLRRHAIKLSVADDLLNVLAERLAEHRVEQRFVWPETADIRQELQALGMDFGADELSGMMGGLSLELVALDEKAGPAVTIAAGRYRGALGGYHRLKSGRRRRPLHGRTLQYMLEQALTELAANLEQLLAASYAVEAEAPVPA